METIKIYWLCEVKNGNTRKLEKSKELETAKRWAKEKYTQNNFIKRDYLVLEEQYSSEENLKKGFTMCSHIRWASYFHSLEE